MLINQIWPNLWHRFTELRYYDFNASGKRMLAAQAEIKIYDTL